MTNGESRKLWDLLYREMVESEVEHAQVLKEMDVILTEQPGGLPFPDRLHLRMKAGNETRAAYEKYQKALEQFRVFIDEGVR